MILGFNLIYKIVTDYQFMWLLNVTNLTPALLEKLSHKLQNYSMVSYDMQKKLNPAN